MWVMKKMERSVAHMLRTQHMIATEGVSVKGGCHVGRGGHGCAVNSVGTHAPDQYGHLFHDDGMVAVQVVLVVFALHRRRGHAGRRRLRLVERGPSSGRNGGRRLDSAAVRLGGVRGSLEPDRTSRIRRRAWKFAAGCRCGALGATRSVGLFFA